MRPFVEWGAQSRQRVPRAPERRVQLARQGVASSVHHRPHGVIASFENAQEMAFASPYGSTALGVQRGSPAMRSHHVGKEPSKSMNVAKQRLTRPAQAAVCAATVVWFASGAVAHADPPTPSGSHPRLFMSAANLSAYTTNAGSSGSAAAGMVAQCQDTIDNANNYTMRGGSDGNYWPESAVACAFAYLTTHNAQFLTQSIKYWRASLNDDQNVGDNLGCVQGVSTDWQTWAQAGGDGLGPPVIATITHDDWYPMRWYGPDIALTYDWLYSAPGVDSALLSQTRTCLTAWIDSYADLGYHHDEAGANYNAGYAVAATLGAIAIGTDGGADGHLWTNVIDTEFTSLVEGHGLAGASGGVGSPAGVMLGGDWGEGWQYGPLSVLEYAASASALEQNGVSLPDMDNWASALAVRNVYATTPDGHYEWCGNGDCDIQTPNLQHNVNELDAVLIGPSNSQAVGWALHAKQADAVQAGSFIYNALAEIRQGTAQDYTTQTPAPPLWYLARGTRQLYARTAWNDPNAFWGVFMSEPALSSDHQHPAASSFVFSRGSDDLIVDSAPYGATDTFDTNAITVDSSVLTGDYAQTQTPWSAADLPWARGTSDGTYGARSDFAHAFDWASTPSDVTYAHREWTMLPEGEVILLDRVHTSAASRNMYLTLHVNTGGGGLHANNGVYQGTVGSSQVVIHPVQTSGATPAVQQPPVGDCSLSCSYPCGACDTARFAVDEYRLVIPGTWAVAIHVIDGIGASEQPAVVDSINSSTIDPGSTNHGVLGASVFRSTKQSYVVASSAQDGVSPSTMTYSVPGTSPGRHIVYDAPEASDGSSMITASVQSGRCVISITAGSGGGYTGHPLMFQVGAASGGCQTTDSTNVASGEPTESDGGMTVGVDGGTSQGHDSGTASNDASTTHGSDAGTHAADASMNGQDGQAAPDGGAEGPMHGGCGCTVAGNDRTVPAGAALMTLAMVLFLSRRRRSA